MLTCKNAKWFTEQVYEIAFGDDAINRDFSAEEVLEELRHWSDLALKVQEETGEI